MGVVYTLVLEVSVFQEFVSTSALPTHYHGSTVLCDPLCHHLTPDSSRSVCRSSRYGATD